MSVETQILKGAQLLSDDFNVFSRKVEDLPLLTSWAYDFDKNRMLYDDDGKPLIVTANEALKVWIYWAIITERYAYVANSDQYGTEIYNVLGYPLSSRAKREEIKRYIIETLMPNPYIVSIDRISMALLGDRLYIYVAVTSIYSERWVETVVRLQ